MSPLSDGPAVVTLPQHCLYRFVKESGKNGTGRMRDVRHRA